MLSADETTEVVICGSGPTGTLLSVLLSQLGISNICIDKEPAIVTDPRGIALDEDGIRALQAAGIMDDMYTKVGRCMGIFNFVGGRHSDLHHKPFMTMDYGTSEGGTGHVGFICHKQPALEESLRARISTAKEKYSQLRGSCTLVSISEDQDQVHVVYRDATGSERTIAATFLVGADGKTGFTRKRYLEPKGILMQQISEIGEYAETWVAMNLKLTLPTPESHPEFPLWKRGFTPEQVYDEFFPPDFRFLCNPDRPAVCGRFGLPQDRLWRFEYVVQQGEDGTVMASAEKVRAIVFPYLCQPGHKYQLEGPVSFPEDCIEILRSRPFFFSARSCNHWALGRVALCGDSAHVFPPYGGQGIASGFRDAMGLAWRLQIACQRLPEAHEGLLRGWYEERKQQLDLSLAATVENGRYVTERNALRIFVRDTYLACVQLIPSWKRSLEQGARREGLCRYSYQPGLHFNQDLHGGGLFPQAYCRLLQPDTNSFGDVQYTDDILFSPGKQSLFQLVVVVRYTSEAHSVEEALQSLDIDTLSDGFVVKSEATLLVEDTTASPARLKGVPFAVARIATALEFAASPLCENRPAPRFYDEYRVGKETSWKPFVIVRPDRFQFAACADVQELRSALQSIKPILSGTVEKVAA